MHRNRVAVPDEGVIMHGHEECREELAVHPVRHTAVSRYNGVEVLDAVGTLYGAGPEASERSDDRDETRHEQRVQLNWSQGHAGGGRSEKQKNAHE